MQLVQHKKEAFWFYRFLSIFYDKLVNPLFWTKRMRDETLELAMLHDPSLLVIDAGSGTGFTTQGIARYISAENITCVDQSPHQMAKAKKKEELQNCNFIVGDAEALPVATDHFDRYISAGSIEYWPDPQQGVLEAYRVIKPGGIAVLIGPLPPENKIARFLANAWMLFPEEKAYRDWYEKAGFTNIKIVYTAPHWIGKTNTYGLAISGVKPVSGLSPFQTTSKQSLQKETDEQKGFGRQLLLIFRVLIGSLAGFLFIPIALLGYLFNLGKQKDVPAEYREQLNVYQIIALILIIGFLIWLIAKLVGV